ncbi:hypothetical protein N7490_001969 [Penicillium lividum]|nr:hypothetical protein N7490_001969 [Penicillium lividum]
MAFDLARIETIVVDSVALLRSVIGEVMTLRTDTPSLFIDLEGCQLGRHESSVILKVLFDVRHDSDALFSHYRIAIDGARDVQLMELGTRTGPKEFLASLAACVEKDSTISSMEKKTWEITKLNTRRLYDPALGGRYEIFNDRPIKPEIVKYCVGDVVLLPGLFVAYNTKLCRPGEKFWEVQILEATKERIQLSQSPNFDGTSQANARGPWTREAIEEAINQWNDDIMDNAMNEEGRDFDFDFEPIFDDFDDNDDDDWHDDGPTSCRDIIPDCDYHYYYSD